MAETIDFTRFQGITTVFLTMYGDGIAIFVNNSQI